MENYPQILKWLWHIRSLNSGEQEMKIMCRDISEESDSITKIISSISDEDPIREFVIPELDGSIEELCSTVELLKTVAETCIRAREAL